MKIRALTVAALSIGLITAGCSTDSDSPSQEADITSAPVVQWESVKGVPLPFSPDAGPATRTPVAIDFAHTPQGAVLAAIHGQAALATAGDSIWPQVVNTVTFPGQGRDEFAASRTIVSISDEASVEDPTQFIGFKIRSYSPETVALDLLAQPANQDDLFAYPVALVWNQDQWRIVLPTSEDNIDAEIVGGDDYTIFEERP